MRTPRSVEGPVATRPVLSSGSAALEALLCCLRRVYGIYSSASCSCRSLTETNQSMHVIWWIWQLLAAVTVSFVCVFVKHPIALAGFLGALFALDGVALVARWRAPAAQHQHPRQLLGNALSAVTVIAPAEAPPNPRTCHGIFPVEYRRGGKSG